MRFRAILEGFELPPIEADKPEDVQQIARKLAIEAIRAGTARPVFWTEEDDGAPPDAADTAKGRSRN